jgi:hypothetical protein
MSVSEFINGKLYSSVNPEETHHILQGHIGSFLNGTPYGTTQFENGSILGKLGEVSSFDYLITTTGKVKSDLSGQDQNVPIDFFDASSPRLWGDSAMFTDWEILKNPNNNIGYGVNPDNSRALHFPHHVEENVNIQPVVSYPALKMAKSTQNGIKFPEWKHDFQPIATPVSNWVPYSQFHSSIRNGI